MEKAGCVTSFTTSNYGVTTTPRKEYEIVMGKRECPEEDMRDRDGNMVRARALCCSAQLVKCSAQFGRFVPRATWPHGFETGARCDILPPPACLSRRRRRS